MGITGNLQTMVLAELLQWLSQGQKTGTLAIDNNSVEKKIYFRDGAIISSASTASSEHIGNFLLAHGYIDKESLDQAIAQQKRVKKMIGQVLVDLGAINAEDLDQMLRFKAEESIYDIFTWEQGDFEFLDGELPAESMVPMNLDVQWIVLEGSRRLDEMTRIREHVPSAQCVPVLVVDLEEIELEEEDHRHVLSWVDDDRTVEEIAEESGATVFLVTQVLAEQVLARRLKVVRPRIIEVPAPKTADNAPLSPQPVFAPQPMPYPQGYPPSAPAGHPIGSLGQNPAFAAPPERTAPAPSAIPIGPPEPKSEAEAMIREGDRLRDHGDLDEALDTYRKAADVEGGEDMRVKIGIGEDKVRQALERDGVKLTAVPRLACDMAKLTQLKLSPREGFMLTRVNGSYDIKSLLKMNPASPLDTQMLFWRLKKSGHVAF